MTQGTLRFTKLFGSQGKYFFEYPLKLNAMKKTVIDYDKDRFVSAITCSLLDGLSALKLHFSDGNQSPQFGHTTQEMLNTTLEIPLNETITGIKICHGKAIVSQLVFQT